MPKYNAGGELHVYRYSARFNFGNNRIILHLEIPIEISAGKLARGPALLQA